MKIVQDTETAGRITGKIQSHEFDILRGMPGRKKWRGRELIFELTGANIEFIHRTFQDAEWDNSTAARIEDVAVMRQLEADKDLPPEAFSFSYKTEPYDHQKTAFALGRDRKVFGYIMDMGTGKSKVLIDNVAYLYASGKADTFLLTAPNGVHRQWVEEQIPRHMPDWVQYRAIIYQPPSYRTKAWEKEHAEVMGFKDGLRIFAMNIEAFQGKWVGNKAPPGVQYAANVLDTGKTLWGVDESTRIKNGSAARTKNVLKLRNLAEYRRILSGAPITRGVEDLFTQLKFLDEDILGFSSFYTFRNHFCVTAPIPGAPPGAVQIVGYKNLEELKQRLQGHSYRVTKEECLDLPEMVYMPLEVLMTPEQKKMYYDIKEDLFTQLDDGTMVTADIAIVQLTKMYQVLCGHIRTEEGDWRPVPNNRIATAMDVIEEAAQKIVIWARYTPDIIQLGAAMKKAGIKYVEYHGGVSTADKAKNKAAFINDDSVIVFLGNPQAAGTGTDGLQDVCGYMMYYSNSFDADTRWQSEDRIHRSGMRDHCVYVDLIIPKSIDVKILKALKAKKDVARSVTDVQDLLAESE